MTRWGVWYDAGAADMGWLSSEGQHGRIGGCITHPDPSGLREVIARQREHDANCATRGWPATTYVIAEIGSSPMRCLLDCPKCGTQHIDEGEWATSRKHKTHQCQACRHEWRPFVYPTVGVADPKNADTR